MYIIWQNNKRVGCEPDDTRRLFRRLKAAKEGVSNMLNKEIFLNHIIIAFAMAVMFLLGTATTASALDETDSDIASGTYDNVPWRITAD